MEPVLSIEHLKKHYGSVVALEDVSFNAFPGEIVVLLGPSGAGKSTVMRCITRLVEPTNGKIIFEGTDTAQLKRKQLTALRRRCGMIFQNYNLVPRLTVLQNVMHGRLGYVSSLKGMLGMYPEEDKLRAVKMIEDIGLGEAPYKRASELSGGQQQRVGIARALMQDPALMLCDEPVASLDPGNSRIVLDLITNAVKERQIGCLISLHQVEFARAYADRIVCIKDGCVVFDDTPDMLTEEIVEDVYSIAPDEER